MEKISLLMAEGLKGFRLEDKDTSSMPTPSQFLNNFLARARWLLFLLKCIARFFKRNKFYLPTTYIHFNVPFAGFMGFVCENYSVRKISVRY